MPHNRIIEGLRKLRQRLDELESSAESLHNRVHLNSALETSALPLMQQAEQIIESFPAEEIDSLIEAMNGIT